MQCLFSISLEVYEYKDNKKQKVRGMVPSSSLQMEKQRLPNVELKKQADAELMKCVIDSDKEALLGAYQKGKSESEFKLC